MTYESASLPTHAPLLVLNVLFLMIYPRIFILVGIMFLCASCERSPYQDGARIYKSYCANCHMDSGEGLGALIPPLDSADYLVKNHDQLPCIVRYGLRDTIIVNGKIYAEEMPPGDKLSDIDITNVLNYVNTHLGNQNPIFTLEEVRARLEKCKH